MAHYIDLCKVKIVSEKFFDENEDALISVGDVRRALLMAPVEDVAPRAEVERLRELNNSLLEAGQEWQKRYENLAREIFEDIGKFNRAPFGYICASRSEIEELKKKYVEGVW